ncbi:MAG TPA: ABC transporter permease [Terriglobales bacterium]|jgi:lipopolysaccharide transport system permease protein|nr:ABC transporter permease [Terriglobales bacterium]
MSSPPEVVKIDQASTPSADATQPYNSAETIGRAARSSDRPIKIIHPPAFSLRTISTGLRTLLQYSDLLYTLSIFRLNVRYKQSALGWAWAAIQPLALMGIYTIVFTRVTRVATGGIPYPIFVFSGLLPWLFFSGSISNAVNGLVLYPNLLTKMYFPREIIPLSYLVASFTDFCIASTILGALMFHYRMPVTWHVLVAIPIVLILAGFSAAISLFFSAIQVRFRDVGLAMPFVLQIWMFTVPVVYSLNAVPERWRSLYLLDPIAGLIEGFRRAVIGGAPPDFKVLGICAAVVAVTLPIGYAFFKSSEATMADVI